MHTTGPSRRRTGPLISLAAAIHAAVLLGSLTPAAQAQNVTFKPYLQPGDSGPFGPADQMVIAWQTDETAPNPSAYTVQFGSSSASLNQNVAPKGRVVDNYLAADSQFSALSIPTAYGAHTDYTAVLTGLSYDTTYSYKVTGPGLPQGGFSASFHTRKKGGVFSFEVQGDEGYYPGVPNSNPARVVNYEARIIHEMWNVSSLSLPSHPALPAPDLALNTGDNVYVAGADSNYRDFWFPTWNSDTDSNETGAPFIRSLPLYIVDGNHDVGSTGAMANLLADDPPTTPGSGGPGRYGGGLGGGDALDFFNNYLFPLDGPTGVDIQNHFVGDNATPTNLFFKYAGKSYDSPTAIEALRASTTVDSGQGAKRQIDHMSNYSFDYGNAHFVFLDANPHLFNNLLPGGPPANAPSFPFTPYPSVLRTWLINDLDSTRQLWKIVVFHQPAFSSGNATISNDQMRTVAKLLEDHGVNLVFNGHEHNYQRSLPLRVIGDVTQSPTTAAPPVVAVDTAFDGAAHSIPDGVLYLVEGAGGDRDFDNNLPNPRGSSLGIDQDDAATGTSSQTVSGKKYDIPAGPASWLDTNLTDSAMIPYFPNAGSGPKITAKFKSKLFSFADVVVNNSSLTMYQISEPLSATHSGQFGTDANGMPVNDPIPDTQIDPATGQVVSTPATGTPALLDQFTVTKPDAGAMLTANLSAPSTASPNGDVTYTVTVQNNAAFALNGAQVVLTLPSGVSLASTPGDTLTQQGNDAVTTIGRIGPGEQRMVQVKAHIPAAMPANTALSASASIRSGTAQPLTLSAVSTQVTSATTPAQHP
jgi:uncharacterized repeat protein (TIGR01451 family)